MIFGNFNNLSLSVFVILFLIGCIFLFLLYKKEKFKILLLGLSFLFLIVNIFEIKGGYNNKMKNIEGGKVVFVMDVSKSMDTLDIINNNSTISRLEASKMLINSYIPKYTNNKYGLIVFAGEALETLPFTSDLGIFKTVLHGLSNLSISKYGTHLNDVFESLQNYFSNNNEGGLAVIFTDGGDENIEISNELLNELSKKGVQIVLIGLGKTSESKIPVGKDFSGNILYKKYKGKEVLTKLNDEVLKNISLKYNIDYISISNKDDFNKINELITKNIKIINIKQNIDYRFNYTRLLVLISFIFFIIYIIISTLGRKK